MMFLFILNLLSSSIAQPDLSKCDIEFSCFLNPPGCSSNCIAIATFFYNKTDSKYVKELWSSASNKWVAFAQKSESSDSDFMVNLLGQYCLLSSSTVLFGSLDATTLTRNTAPKWISTVPGVEMVSSAVLNDGSFGCRYTTSDTSSSNVYLAIAFGSSTNGQLPSYHGYNNYLTSSGKVSLSAVGTTGATTTVQATSTNKVNKPDLSKCDIEFSCFLNPPGCSSNCIAIATFFYDKSNGRYVKELWSSGSNKWVAFAQKLDNLNYNFMVNLQGQYCLLLSSTVLFGSLDATAITSNTAPKWIPTVPGVEMISSAVLNDGSFGCRYTTNDTLNSNVFLAIAFGSSTNGQLPSYHGPNNYLKSSGKVSLNVVGTPVVTTEAMTTIQATSTNKGNKPDLSKCDIEFNCFLNPPGCSSNCIAIATFFYDKSNGRFVKELWSSASNKWVAFAQKSDDLNSYFMVNLQGQYCLLSSSTVLFGSLDATTITSNTAPKWISTIPGIVLSSANIFNDGSFSCRYTTNDTSSSNVFLAIAFGSSTSGPLPNYHGYNNYAKSAGKVNLTAIQLVSSGSSLSSLKKAHGILMTFGWLFFATCGIFMSRYMKPFLKKKISGKDTWFRMHQLFMSSTLICFVIGLILILVDLKGIWSENAGAHHILGLTAIVLGLVQPCIALLRCTPDHKDRYIFNWVHRFIGITAWLIAAIAVIFGLKLLNINHVAVVIFIPVVVILFIMLDLILLKNKPNLEKSKPQVTYSSTQFDMETTSRENKTDEYISVFFMVALFTFVAAVAISVSVSIKKFTL